MGLLPVNLSRVPNLLASQIINGSITRANVGLLGVQEQLASGRRINVPSDDAIGTSVISVLDDIIERREQRLRNLSNAEGVLNSVDAALADLNDLLIEAKGVASSQIGVGSDAQTRKNQALVINSMLAEAIDIAGRKFQQVQLFGGAASDGPPIGTLFGGVQYHGEGPGLFVDLDQSIPFPITVSADSGFGTLSARVQGNRDLDPIMPASTRLVDLNGARGLGISLGSINVDVGGTDITVDLSAAHTVQDVIDTLQTAMLPYDAGITVQVDGITNNRLEIIPTVAPVTITDPASDATAADLGINMTFMVGGDTGGDLDPRITDSTLLANLTGVTFPLGTIRLTNMGQTRDLDLSAVTKVEELRNAVEGLNLGIRVEIADTGDRLDFVNELSGGTMSIGEVAGGLTATELGVRSYTSDTRLSDFNDGLGIQIRSGSVDPITGLPDPARDLDIRITAKNGAMFDIDFTGATTVQDILDAINAVTVGSVTATLAADGNGIQLDDITGGGGSLTVESLNGSFAGTDLGMIGTTLGAMLVSQDRATVAVAGVFSHLIALRDALETNDERGIGLAGSKLEADITRATETRAEVGVRSRRVRETVSRQEDLQIQDGGLKSTVQDLDFTEAALRFSLLEQQLQAALATAARLSTVSLLDFLR